MSGRRVVVVNGGGAVGWECVCVCVAELLGVAALLSVAAPLSLYNLSQPYSGFYCGRWFCSVLHRFASLCCLSAHIYLSEKA